MSEIPGRIGLGGEARREGVSIPPGKDPSAVQGLHRGSPRRATEELELGTSVE